MEWIKGHLLQFGIFLLAFIAPIQGILILLGFLLVSDLMTGLWKSHKKGHKITSGRMSHTISKMVLYALTVILTHGMEQVFPTLSYLHLTHIAGGYICLVELKSVYENVSEITGLDIWSHLVKQAKGLKKIADDLPDGNSGDRASDNGSGD